MHRSIAAAVIGIIGSAAIAVAPTFAEYEFCLTDPAVSFDGHTVEVGLYTYNQSLVQTGAITGPMVVVLEGHDVSTNIAAWSAVRSTHVFAIGDTRGHDSELTIDAFVPSSLQGDSFFIKVTYPDGHVRTSHATPVNRFVTLHLPADD